MLLNYLVSNTNKLVSKIKFLIDKLKFFYLKQPLFFVETKLQLGKKISSLITSIYPKFSSYLCSCIFCI